MSSDPAIFLPLGQLKLDFMFFKVPAKYIGI